jgi:hypothetical protein
MHVVLDIETEPYSNRFKRATSLVTRRKCAPKPRLACLYVVETKRYHFYSGASVCNVVPVLKAATGVVTFCGEIFDFLVLERHCGLKRDSGFREKCVDMNDVITALDSRFRISLDRASRLNLGVGKKVKGSILGTAAVDILKKGCRSDVRQAYQIFRAWREGKLLFPVRPERDLPKTCPGCGKELQLVPFQPDYTGMTDGQIFDYELGHQQDALGYARCTECRAFVVWGV